MKSAAPSAPPASPAAGCTQMRSKEPSRRTRRSLAIERNAPSEAQVLLTGPLMDVPRHAEHDFLGPTWTDAAMSMSCCVRGDSGRARGLAEQAMELGRRHRQALAVIEIRHVHAERAVVLQVDQVPQKEVREAWLAVRGEPHTLYSPLLTLKPV